MLDATSVCLFQAAPSEGIRRAHQGVKSLLHLQHRDGKMLMLKFTFNLPTSMLIERNVSIFRINDTKAGDFKTSLHYFRLS
jgi:hypothetical protein